MEFINVEEGRQSKIFKGPREHAPPLPRGALVWIHRRANKGEITS